MYGLEAWRIIIDVIILIRTSVCICCCLFAALRTEIHTAATRTRETRRGSTAYCSPNMTAPADSLWTAALGLRAAVFTLPWLVHLFAADALLSALLPVSAVFPNLAYNLSSRIAESVWRGIQLIFTRFNGANIVVSRETDRLPRGESAIVVSNHGMKHNT